MSGSVTRQGTTITMPKLGESVTEGTLGAWLKQVGDSVDKYEPMVEVVTDKVTAEIPAPVAGTIVEIIGGEGDTIPVGGAICVIAADGTRPNDMQAAPSESAAPETAVPQAADPAVDSATPLVASPPNGARPKSVDLAAARASGDEMALLRARSSPLVRRLAEEHEVDLTAIEGSGIGGRVTKADIMARIESSSQPSAAASSPVREPESVPERAAPVSPPIAPLSIELMPGDDVVEASAMRKQIAEHMTRSVQTAPHVTVWMEADMSNVVRARERFKEEFEGREGFSLTFLPFVARVVAQALREHPNINAAWDNGRVIRRRAIHLGVAVAMEDGLIVPVLKNADEKNIVGIARAVADLVDRARVNKLQPDDLHGGTFTLNNPGTLGSLFSTPIIVQPQAAILSMEAIVKRPVVIDDAIAIRPMMNLSLSIDHRVLDGLAATRFLASVRKGLEEFPVDASIY